MEFLLWSMVLLIFALVVRCSFRHVALRNHRRDTEEYIRELQDEISLTRKNLWDATLIIEDLKGRIRQLSLSEEDKFKDLVESLIVQGVYPSARKICSELGRGKANLSGRECKWRTEIFEQYDVEKQ